MKTGRFITADPAEYGGPVEFWNKQEKRTPLMQVATIFSIATSSPRAAEPLRERKVGGKEEHFLPRVQRVTASPYYNFLLSPAVAACDPARFTLARLS